MSSVTSNHQDGRRVKGEARRREILQAAMELFARGGFNSVSLGDVAKQVGITQAGILHYFPSKAALLLAVLQEREDRNAELTRRRREAGVPPLEEYVQLLAENEKHPELVQLFVVLTAESTAVDHPGHEWILERRERAKNHLRQGVRDVIDEALLPPGTDLDTIVRWLLALSEGLAVQWISDPTAFDRAGDIARFIEMLRPYMRDSAPRSDAPKGI